MRRRLLLSYLSITLLVLIALGLPLGLSYANTEDRRLRTEVHQDAAAFAERAAAALTAGTSVDAADLRMVVDRYAGEREARVVIVDADGDVAAASPGAAASADLPAVRFALGGTEAHDRYASDGLGDAVAVAMPVRADGTIRGAVLVEVSRAETAARIRNGWLLLGALSGAILLVVGLVSTLLARSFAKPLADLDRGAARLGEGDLAVRVEVPDDPPELAGLARSFNATAERLETLVRSQQAFVTDASHQLRTPLAALRLRLENLEAEYADGGAHPEDLERALAEVQRLSQLVDSLLVLTRAEADRRAPEAVDLAAVVADRRDAWSAFAAEAQVRLETEAPPVAVRSVPGRIEQVLDNLISNALDVAPPGSAVRVVAESTEDLAVVHVCDAGPGIPSEHRARAFDRFWRGDAARRDDGGGFGLGLAIVRELVAADGGDVQLGDAPEGGLRVTFRLPLAAPPPARRGAPDVEATAGLPAAV